MTIYLQLALPALLALSRTAAAQELLAEVGIWNKKGCGDNLNDPDLDSITIEVYENIQIKDPEDLKDSCMGMIFSPAVGSDNKWDDGAEDGTLKGFVDQQTIPDGCEFVLFDGPPTDAEGQGACFEFIRRIPHENKCGSFNFKKEFSYSMCCGTDACAVAAGQAPTRRTRANIVRDVTRGKRASPFERREDCKFTPNDSDEDKPSSIIWYGLQEKVSGDQSCGTEECTTSIEFTHETSIATSTTIGASAGATFFEVLSVSVSMEQTWTNERSDSFSATYGSTRPPGSKGYITWRQKYECTPKGKFSGDCDWDTGKETDGCFPLFVNKVPDGIATFVQTN